MSWLSLICTTVAVSPARPPTAAVSRRQGQLSCVQVLRALLTFTHTCKSQFHCSAQSRYGACSPECCSLKGTDCASSPALTPSGQAHPCLYHWDQIHCVAQARFRPCSPEYCSQRGDTANSPALRANSPNYPRWQVGRGEGHDPAPVSPHNRGVVEPALPHS